MKSFYKLTMKPFFENNDPYKLFELEEFKVLRIEGPEGRQRVTAESRTSEITTSMFLSEIFLETTTETEINKVIKMSIASIYVETVYVAFKIMQERFDLYKQNKYFTRKEKALKYVSSKRFINSFDSEFENLMFAIKNFKETESEPHVQKGFGVYFRYNDEKSPKVRKIFHILGVDNQGRLDQDVKNPSFLSAADLVLHRTQRFYYSLGFNIRLDLMSVEEIEIELTAIKNLFIDNVREYVKEYASLIEDIENKSPSDYLTEIYFEELE